MRIALLIFLSILILGCNGEIESQVIASSDIPIQEIKKPTIEIVSKINDDLSKPASRIDLDSGFREVGHYEEPVGCMWTIYKREFRVTWLYIHEDCNGERIKIHKDK